MFIAIILLSLVVLLGFAGLFKGMENQNLHIQSLEKTLVELVYTLQSFGGDKS